METKTGTHTVLGTKTLMKRLVQLLLIAGIGGCVNPTSPSLDDFLEFAHHVCPKFPDAIIAYGVEHEGQIDSLVMRPLEAPPPEPQGIAQVEPRFWLKCGGRVRDVESD